MKRLVCGPRAVGEALRAAPGAIHLVLLEKKNRGVQKLGKEAASRGVDVEPCRNVDLDALTDLRHQGIIAITGDYPYVSLDDLTARADAAPEPSLLLALDQVQDVHNVGSLLRSAVALGAHGIILCRHGGAPVSSAAVRVSAGASEHAKVARVKNLARTVTELQDRRITVVGLDAAAPTELRDVDLTEPLALVVGSEGSGLRRLVRERCDLLASVPLAGPVSSLNVSVAGAVGLYEVLRQRRTAGGTE